LKAFDSGLTMMTTMLAWSLMKTTAAVTGKMALARSSLCRRCGNSYDKLINLYCALHRCLVVGWPCWLILHPYGHGIYGYCNISEVGSSFLAFLLTDRTSALLPAAENCHTIKAAAISIFATPQVRPKPPLSSPHNSFLAFHYGSVPNCHYGYVLQSRSIDSYVTS